MQIQCTGIVNYIRLTSFVVLGGIIIVKWKVTLFNQQTLANLQYISFCTQSNARESKHVLDFVNHNLMHILTIVTYNRLIC